jgi:hypothetical protein
MFGIDSTFGQKCVFDGQIALPGHPMMTMSGVGSSNLTIYAFNVEGGPIFEIDKFIGNIDTFRAKVIDDDAFKRLQCLGFADIVASVWYPEKVEKSRQSN